MQRRFFFVISTLSIFIYIYIHTIVLRVACVSQVIRLDRKTNNIARTVYLGRTYYCVLFQRYGYALTYTHTYVRTYVYVRKDDLMFAFVSFVRAISKYVSRARFSKRTVPGSLRIGAYTSEKIIVVFFTEIPREYTYRFVRFVMQQWFANNREPLA